MDNEPTVFETKNIGVKDIKTSSSGNIIESEINGKRLIIAGFDHTTKYEDYKPALDMFNGWLESNKNNKILVIVEGTESKDVAEKLVQDNREMDEREIVNSHGEQVAIAYLALRNGVKTECWDLSFMEQMSEISENFGRDNTLLWFLSQSFIHLRIEQKNLDLDNVKKMIESRVGVSSKDLENIMGTLTKEMVDRLLNDKLGYDTDKINSTDLIYKKFSRLSDPTLTEEELSDLSPQEQIIAKIPKLMGNIRDKLAIGYIRTIAADTNTTELFVSCGKTHADEWMKILPDINQE
jgi:hypothetical protein